jgi:hypothetical protein
MPICMAHSPPAFCGEARASGLRRPEAERFSRRCGRADPGLIRAPVAIIRGEWDSLVQDADARWLFDALRASPLRRDSKVVIPGMNEGEADVRCYL